MCLQSFLKYLRWNPCLQTTGGRDYYDVNFVHKQEAFDDIGVHLLIVHGENEDLLMQISYVDLLMQISYVQCHHHNPAQNQ